jgi:hypothetical protein
VIGIVTIVHYVIPSPQQQSTAEISVADVERNVTFGYYLARAGSPSSSLSRADLNRRGVLVVLHYAIAGYRGKQLPLRWTLFDASGATADGGQAIVRPGTNADGFDGYVWVRPRGPRRYYVVATLVQPNGRITLASKRTSDFAGLPS